MQKSFDYQFCTDIIFLRIFALSHISSQEICFFIYVRFGNFILFDVLNCWRISTFKKVGKNRCEAGLHKVKHKAVLC